MAHVWSYFCEVHRGDRLTYAELQAWASMTGRSLSPQQVDIIMRLDVEVARAMQ